ncbi:Nicotinamidase-related amidase [Sporobacter termitidis DSM 10068]|uniref:Nicotinamidase-related amidase n=1 Tax=Sporobacter termitidis DSM 10068 TaxID=1123282 RepID=A0A1M5ZEJ4_9FIRM|nr:cysteine hydrolase family protein [Sporobacter termitidis]SHI22647.1 Nicotinamidase-related amidase [Sporobacter termitidis DSM 10068]
MNYDALIVIDMQTALIEEHPYNEAAVIENIKNLLGACRAKKIPVIHVQHDGGAGDALEHGGKGWEIWSALAPMPGEKIFEKQYNSAFRNTGLHDYLKTLPAKNIILCGMQTEYCIDASCKVAFEYGYNVTVPRAAATTFDSAFASGKALSEYYEDRIWNNRYARVIPMEQTISEIND